MTRRDFARFVSMMCVVMVGSLKDLDHDVSATALERYDHHIKNRRLFNMAAGTTTLVGWERDHLHKSGVCHTMGSVLIRSIERYPHLEFKREAK